MYNYLLVPDASTATHCKALQHTATHCNTHIICSSLSAVLLEVIDTKCIIVCSCLLRALQHTAAHCNTLQRTATHCNALQRTATHCNTLQHTAKRCNTLQHTHHLLKPPASTARSHRHKMYNCLLVPSASTATHCNILQHTAAHCNALQNTATHCKTLQNTAKHCYTHCNSHCTPSTPWRWQARRTRRDPRSPRSRRQRRTTPPVPQLGCPGDCGGDANGAQSGRAVPLTRSQVLSWRTNSALNSRVLLLSRMLSPCMSIL